MHSVMTIRIRTFFNKLYHCLLKPLVSCYNMDEICQFYQCENKVKRGMFCAKHLPKCSKEGCNLKAIPGRHGLCKEHDREWMYQNKPEFMFLVDLLEKE